MFVIDECNHFMFNVQIWLVEVVFIVLDLETLCSKKEVLINSSI